MEEKSRERLLTGIFIALLVLILLIGILVGLFFTGGLGNKTTIVEVPGTEDVSQQDTTNDRLGEFVPIPLDLIPDNGDDESVDDTGDNPPPGGNTGNSGSGSSSGNNDTDDPSDDTSSDGDDTSSDNSDDGDNNNNGGSSPRPTNTPSSNSNGGNNNNGGGSNNNPKPTQLPPTPTAVPADLRLPQCTGSTVGVIQASGLPEDPLDRINAYRAAAGVTESVSFDSTLSDGAQKHAEYMTKNGAFSSTEIASNPGYTTEGLNAAQRSNMWFGNGVGTWDPWVPIDEWMSSPFHRIWILYPRAVRLGWGWHDGLWPALNNIGGTAAVLTVFGGWDNSADFDPLPLVYPGDGQTEVPAACYNVSIQFPFGEVNPTISDVEWTDDSGGTVAFGQIDPGNNAYMREYGNTVYLVPEQALAPSTTYEVHVVGVFDGTSFDVTWNFTTEGD